MLTPCHPLRAMDVAESPALQIAAAGLDPATLDVFDALRCELDGLMSPAAIAASPLATLDGNRLQQLGVSPSLRKAPHGGGLQLSFRKTVSTPTEAAALGTPPPGLGLRTSSAYQPAAPSGMASTSRVLTTAAHTPGAFTWSLPAGDEGLPARTASPDSAPASPPDMPAEESSPQLRDKLSRDAAMLDAEVLRVQHGLVERARLDADKRLRQVKVESAARLAAAQREGQQREATSRKRAEEQVQHAQRIVRLEMQHEVERAQNDATLQLRTAEQQSAQHVAAYQQQAFEMVRKATQSSKAQAEELVADARRQAEARASDVLQQCECEIQAVEANLERVELQAERAVATADVLRDRLVGKQCAARQQRTTAVVLRSWRGYAEVRRRNQRDGAQTIHVRALQARLQELELSHVENLAAGSVITQQRERIVSTLCQRRARAQQSACFAELVRFAGTQRALSLASYRAVVWRRKTLGKRVLHAWKLETEAMAERVAALLFVAAAVVPDALRRWVAFTKERQAMHRMAARLHRRKEIALFGHWREVAAASASQRVEAAERKAEMDAARSGAAASLAESQRSERTTAEACAEAEQRAWAESAARSAAEAQLAQLNSTLAQQTRELEQAQEEARGAVADARAAESEMTQVRTARAASEEARREDAAALQDMVTEAVAKEGRAVGEAELASQSLQRAQAEEARLSESSTKQTERIELLQRSLAEAKDRLRVQSAGVSRLASASSESRADHEATVQSLRSAIAALRDSLEAEQKRNTESEQRLAVLSGQCETLRQAVASLEAAAGGLRAEAEAALAALAEETARGEALRVSWVAQEESHVAALESLELSVIEQMRSEQEDADALVEGRAVRAAVAMVGARRRQGVGRCFSAWARLLWMEMAIAAASSGGMAEQAGGFEVHMSA